MEIKRNSLHFRLYRNYASGPIWDLEHGRVNFCQYSRKVMGGFILALSVVVLGVIGGLGPMQFLGTYGLWLFTDNPLIPFITLAGTPLGVMGHLGIAAFVIEVAALGFVGGIELRDYIADKRRDYIADKRPVREVENKPDGFLTTWYLAWKLKYCPVVTLEKNDIKTSQY